jgi:hypothetical protein
MSKPNALSRRLDHSNGSSNNDNTVLLKPELFAIWALEGLAVKGEGKEIVQVRRKNRMGEVEMQVAAAVKGLKGGNRRTMVGSEWREENGLIIFCNRIYMPRDDMAQARLTLFFAI